MKKIFYLKLLFGFSCALIVMAICIIYHVNSINSVQVITTTEKEEKQEVEKKNERKAFAGPQQKNYVDWSQYLKVYMIDPRPDESRQGKNLILRVQDQREELISLNEKIFPFEDDGLYIVPTKIEDGKLLFLAYISDLKEGTADIFALDIMEEELSSNIFDDPALTFFKDIKIYEPDLFLEELGSAAREHRMTIGKEKIIYFKSRDLFIYKDKFWQKAQSLEAAQEYALAIIEEISSSKATIKIWLQCGKLVVLTLPIQKGVISLKEEGFLQGMRLRTERIVSCQMGKQRMILKPKDLLMKKEEKWVHVKKEEIMNNLAEIFYVIGVENSSLGKKFKGIYFNEARDDKKIIEVPMISSNKSMKREGRRK